MAIVWFIFTKSLALRVLTENNSVTISIPGGQTQVIELDHLFPYLV